MSNYPKVKITKKDSDLVRIETTDKHGETIIVNVDNTTGENVIDVFKQSSRHGDHFNTWMFDYCTGCEKLGEKYNWKAVEVFRKHWHSENRNFQIDSSTLLFLEKTFDKKVIIEPCEYRDCVQIRFGNGEEVNNKKLQDVLGGDAVKVDYVDYGFDEGKTSYRICLNPKWVELVELGLEEELGLYSNEEIDNLSKFREEDKSE